MGNDTAAGAFDRVAERLLPEDPAGLLINLGSFLAIVLIGVLAGWLVHRIQLRVIRGPPNAGQTLLAKFIQGFLVTASVVVGLSAVYEVNVFGLLATLGLVSLALGFGLQNTVANLAAGVGLTIDRPFDVGDRIRVEETWGDVLAIGMRSTRIITTAGEHVVIPNAVLDTQAVWNYSQQGAARVRVELIFGISYGSSLELAENLSLRAARSSEGVLAYPPPEVVLGDFGDSDMTVKLRFWVRKPKDRNKVRNRVMRAVKDAFDEKGVHFPFPQRTLSYLADQPEPAPTPEHLEGEAASRPVILVLELGTGDPEFARRVVAQADLLNARLVVLHVRPSYAAMDREKGAAAINGYLVQAQRAGVPASGRTEAGYAADVLVAIAKEVGASLVFVDARRNFRLPPSRRPGNGGNGLHCPLIWLEANRDPPRAAVEQWDRLLHPDDEDEEEDEEPDVTS